MSMKLSRKKINEMVDRDYSYSGRRGGGSGAAGGGGVSEGWVDDNYVSKLFWSNIFVIHKKVTTVVMNGETEISRTVDTTGVFTPNEQPSVKSTTDQQTGYVTTVKTEIDSIEAKKGFWTNYYVSALGQGSGGGGGGGGGGSSTLQGLLDVNIPATMTQENNGQVLMYNYQQNRWINANLPASGVTSIGLSMPTGFSVDPATISSSGTFQVTFASGYSLPKTENVNKGVTAYGWGNHATAGYVKANDVYSKTDADNKFLTIAAFERLFNALNSSNQKVNHPYSSGVASIKALFGLWTEQYVSALGQGSGGGGGGGGATLFEPLDSINNAGLGLPTGSKFLLYNGSAWVYANSPLGDISTLQGYFTNGAANTAVKLKTARNLWKQPFDGSEDVRGDLCLVPTTGNANSDSAKLLFQTHTSASEHTYGPYIQAINVANYGRKRLAIFQKNDADWTTEQTEVFSILPTGNVGIGTTNPAEKLTVNGNIMTATADGTYIQIGGARIVWDYDHNALKVVKSDGTSAANFYATGGVSALGQGDSGGGSSETLAGLLDVEFVGDPTNGQVLKYNESTHKWYNGTDQAGTVTSVGLAMPTGFQVSGSPVTTSGTLTVTFGGSVSANRVLAAPNGSAGAPAWRKLVAADIPNLAASKITSGTFDAERLPDMSGTYATTGRVTTLEGYFTDGVANNSAQLSGLEKTAFPILNVTGCAKIESGTNLNQITDFGTYYSPSESNSATLINTPHTTSNFKLLNMWCGGTNYGLQFVFAYNKGMIYVRGKNSTTWSDWRTVAFLDSTIAEATKLETARTIWGQSFDGSANVSGDLSSVGAITMSGNILMDNTHSVQIKNANNTYLRLLTVDSGSNFVIGETVDANQHNTYLRGRSFTFQSIPNGGTTADRTTLMQLTNSGRLYLPLANQGIRIGDGVIVWDSANNALKVIKYDNSAANFYATGGVSALGQGQSGGGGGGSSTLAELNDVEFSGTLVGGQVLTYDDSGNKWHNAFPSWYNLTDTPNTIASYGIQDCYIYNGIIRIGNDELEPITSLAGYATESWVQQQGYLTSETYRGTVTSVGLSMPTGFQVRGGPITSSGTLSVSFGGSITANRVLAAPNGSNGAPSWRKLVAADMPDLSGTYATTGRVETLEGYFTNGVADAAAKLDTARTLWGQSFDGTANVSGDLSSVGAITMSGNILMDNTHSVQIKNANNTYLRLLTVDSGSNFVIGETVDANHHNTYLRGQTFTFQSIPASGTTADRTILMQLNASGRLYLPKGDQGIRIGDGVIVWDSANNALKIQKYDGTKANLYATGGISALEQSN